MKNKVLRPKRGIKWPVVFSGDIKNVPGIFCLEVDLAKVEICISERICALEATLTDPE